MVNITGGSGPYSYDLDETGIYPLVNTDLIPTPGDSLISSLCAGNHTIYITDVNDCEGAVLPGGVGAVHIDSGRIVRARHDQVVTPTCSNINNCEAQVYLPSNDLSYSWQTSSPTPLYPSGVILGTNTIYSNFYSGFYWLVASYAPASNFGLPIPGCDAIDLVTIPGVDSITFDATVIPPSCWVSPMVKFNSLIYQRRKSFSPGSPYTIEFDASNITSKWFNNDLSCSSWTKFTR